MTSNITSRHSNYLLITKQGTKQGSRMSNPTY